MPCSWCILAATYINESLGIPYSEDWDQFAGLCSVVKSTTMPRSRKLEFAGKESDTCSLIESLQGAHGIILSSKRAAILLVYSKRSFRVQNYITTLDLKTLDCGLCKWIVKSDKRQVCKIICARDEKDFIHHNLHTCIMLIAQSQITTVSFISLWRWMFWKSHLYT